MQELAGWMQGCRTPVPVEGLKHSPVSKPCVGSALGTHAVQAQLAARSTCPVPGAVFAKPVFAAHCHGWLVWPAMSNPTTVPCQIAHVNSIHVSFDFTLWY